MTSIVSARTVILVELLRGPGTFAELVRRVAERSRGEVGLSHGSGHTALRELVEEGNARAELEQNHPGPGGAPKRYTLTVMGATVANLRRQHLAALFAETEAG